MTILGYRTPVVCLLAISISACGKETEQLAVEQTPLIDAIENVADDSESTTAQWAESSELALAGGATETIDSPATILDPSDIPYPLYPNGSRYRIGGQGELKIVLFQTEDSFEDVDAYYQAKAGMPRLSAMSDHVRYTTDSSDIDPWETSRPGIVIHQFNDASEREAVGANNDARTNIIMSFE